MKRVALIKSTRNNMAERNSQPMQSEIDIVSKFKIDLFNKGHAIMDKSEVDNPGIRKMSSLEKNQMIIKYWSMCERPDNFMM